MWVKNPQNKTIMRLKINNKAGSSVSAVIIPVAKQGSLENILAKIATKTGVPLKLLKEDFKANHKEIHTLYTEENKVGKRTFLLGLGEAPTFAEVVSAFRSFAFKKKTILPSKIGIHFNLNNVGKNLTSWVDASINGLFIGRYDIGRYKTEEKTNFAFSKKDTLIELYVPKVNVKAVENAMNKGRAAAETQLEIFDLVNAPSNMKPPQVLADWAVKSGKKNGFKVKVFKKKEIEKLGLHALLAVNRGSELPPTFIVMEYKPKGLKNAKKVGLVGKGVTFDTGGLSIKPSTNMHYMKTDMGGAAAVLGAMELTAKLNLPIHLIGIVPATDNSVDALSIKPSDVIQSYSGKSIEIIDTDAEGRLILADGLAYMIKHFAPDVLIDLATLTGSCVRTFGSLSGGLFSKNDELSKALLKASEQTGERIWRLPLWDDYKNYIKSDVADIKNFSGLPTGGAITAAKFLEFFTDNHPSWAHMDIAGVAVSDSEYSSQKSATGFGVRLLVEFLENMVQ
jgi:leucyl aminopeptidase